MWNFKDICTGIVILLAGLFCLSVMGSCVYLNIQKERATIELYKAAARGEASGITIVNGEIRR
jgi:hypothetical protein